MEDREGASSTATVGQEAERATDWARSTGQGAKSRATDWAGERNQNGIRKCIVACLPRKFTSTDLHFTAI